MEDLFAIGKRLSSGLIPTSPLQGAVQGAVFAALMLVVFLPGAATVNAQGQQGRQGSDRHIVIERSDPIARRAGFNALPNQNKTFQTVKFILPKKAVVQVAGPAGFAANPNAPGLFGLRQGDIYRFKVTSIPYAPGRVLYPTLEIIGALTPPPGHETEFPIPVDLPQEDLDSALAGSLVTRVVYLEPTHNAIPADSTNPGGGLFAEAPPMVDPVAFAESNGRVMAILRIGSRIPGEEFKPDSPFYFGLPPWILPNAPRRQKDMTLLNSQWKGMESTNSVEAGNAVDAQTDEKAGTPHPKETNAAGADNAGESEGNAPLGTTETNNAGEHQVEEYQDSQKQDPLDEEAGNEDEQDPAKNISDGGSEDSLL